MSHRGFDTTRWTLVLAARGDDTAARGALEALCAAYWYPLYAYVRRWGHGPADAEDLTQAFFTRLLERRDLAAACRERGRLRSFLLAALRHFLINDAAGARAVKRGGGLTPRGIEFEGAEQRYGLEPRDAETPETLFERRWALTILERTLARLRNNALQSGDGTLFDALRPAIAGESLAGGYAGVARTFGMTESAIKVAVHRLRRRFRDALRAEIAQTVDSEHAVDEELRHLMTIIRR